MRATGLNVGLFVTFLFLGEAVSTPSAPSDEKTGKHFSLFSVVTFKNEECTSDTSMVGGSRKGTCFTTTECSDKGGVKSGNCASGFGVCCVFIENSGADATISQNRTLLRNAEFPSTTTATAATTIVYTLQKVSSDICQIRLDFIAFTLAGPANSKETIVGTTLAQINHCTNDAITFAQSGGSAVPQMCGALTGEHLYVDLGFDATDTSVVTLIMAATVVPATALRSWDIYTQQIECYASYRAPEGCHRYFMSNFGKVISMNFLSLTTTTLGDNGQNSGIELGSQNLKTCIRRSKGMCCVLYQVCTSFNGIQLATDITGETGTTGIQGVFNAAWSIDTNTFPMDIAIEQANAGMVDAQCTSDYVEIPSSWSGACGANGSARMTVNTRYCGAGFGANLHYANAGTKHTPVCDCSEPFSVVHFSDMADDLGGTGNIGVINGINTNINVAPRGFCLDFVQQTCYY